MTLQDILYLQPKGCEGLEDSKELLKAGVNSVDYCWALGMVAEKGKDIKKWKQEHCIGCDFFHGGLDELD